MSQCPSAEQLDGYIAGAWPEAELAAIETHIEQCNVCRNWLEDARANEALFDSVRQVLNDSAANDPVRTKDPAGAPPIETIANYRIIREIGRGGMGIVYEAEQDNPRRTVALKVIRTGVAAADSLRRFEFEAQVLGRLHHPGIAQIYEAGTADTGAGPQPFFAMELIEGRRVLIYARQMRLTTRQCLKLFAKVCHAVQHAHQKGVIHRDIKPGNILVDETGQPKILDFGVARATDSDLQATTLKTDIGQLVGTLPYMSPEQVSGDPAALDTRSDVYSLGVVLYELLVGRLPYDVRHKSVPEAARVIRDEEPASPSSVNRLLRGDIETILSKALEKDVARRYQSASALAADIERYLHDAPIAARPASAYYQFQKFARRNRALVGGIVGAFLFLVLGIIGTSWQTFRATRAETEARRERDDAVEAREAEARQRASAERIQKYLENILATADPYHARGLNLTMKEALDEAVSRIDTDLAQMPIAAAAINAVVGRSYSHMGLYNEARPLLENALTARRESLGDQDLDTAQSLQDLAALLKEQAEYQRAAELYNEAAEILRRQSGGVDALSTCLSGWAGVLVELRDHDRAESVIREAVSIQRERLGELDSPELAGAVNNLAWVLFSKGQIAQSEPYYREALEMRMRIYGGEHPEVALSLDNLAGVIGAQGDAEGAEPLYRQALAMRKSLLGQRHPDVASTLYYLGRACRAQDKFEEAAELLSEALDIRREKLGPAHRDFARTLQYLCRVLLSLDRPAAAEELLREMLSIETDQAPWDVVNSLLGRSLAEQGRYEQAEALLLKSCENLMKRRGRTHEDTRDALRWLAQLYEAWEKPAQMLEYRALLKQAEVEAAAGV